MRWRKPKNVEPPEPPFSLEALADLCSKPGWAREATDQQLVDIQGYQREITRIIGERRTKAKLN